MNNDYEVIEFLGALDPFIILNKWLEEAKQIPSLKDPWAMNFSTVNNQKPSSRIVLLKYIKEESLVFFTNYLSKKGKDLEKNNQAHALFFWDSLCRQIRISGFIKKTSREENVNYWNKRSIESRFSQFISQQSEAVSSGKELENLYKETVKKFLNQSPSCPPHWGGYQLFVESIEFWQGRQHRLHDRFLFEKVSKKWKISRLFP